MTDDQIVRLCARRAARRACPGVGGDELLQAGRIALWQARSEGRVPADDLHAVRYLVRRCYGAMVDAQRTEWRQRPPTVEELTDLTPLDAAPGQPDALVQMREAIARVLRLGTAQLARLLDLLAGGADDAEAAAVLGVSPSRVSRLRSQARRLAAPCWSPT